MVGNLDRRVHREALEIGSDAALADALADRAALGLQRAVGVVVVERRAQGIGEADDEALLALPECLGDPAQGAAGPSRADEGVDLTDGLLPDLRHVRPVNVAAVGYVVIQDRPGGPP